MSSTNPTPDKTTLASTTSAATPDSNSTALGVSTLDFMQQHSIDIGVPGVRTEVEVYMHLTPKDKPRFTPEQCARIKAVMTTTEAWNKVLGTKSATRYLTFLAEAESAKPSHALENNSTKLGENRRAVSTESNSINSPGQPAKRPPAPILNQPKLLGFITNGKFFAATENETPNGAASPSRGLPPLPRPE